MPEAAIEVPDNTGMASQTTRSLIPLGPQKGTSAGLHSAAGSQSLPHFPCQCQTPYFPSSAVSAISLMKYALIMNKKGDLSSHEKRSVVGPP